jgi:hypothetical protein
MYIADSLLLAHFTDGTRLSEVFNAKTLPALMRDVGKSPFASAFDVVEIVTVVVARHDI